MAADGVGITTLVLTIFLFFILIAIGYFIYISFGAFFRIVHGIDFKKLLGPSFEDNVAVINVGTKTSSLRR